jgi:hypothetical protein
LFAAFGRWNVLGWHGREQRSLTFFAPGQVALTPAQLATAYFFLGTATLALVQTLVGAASQHYRADVAGFFGIELAQLFPYNLTRTWHVQLAIFRVSTSFLAAGIFLTPMIAGGREPRGQHVLADLLLGALVAVVAASLLGEWAGIFGLTGELWSWIGAQASSTWTSAGQRCGLAPAPLARRRGCHSWLWRARRSPPWHRDHADSLRRCAREPWPHAAGVRVARPSCLSWDSPSGLRPAAGVNPQHEHTQLRLADCAIRRIYDKCCVVVDRHARIRDRRTGLDECGQHLVRCQIGRGSSRVREPSTSSAGMMTRHGMQ